MSSVASEPPGGSVRQIVTDVSLQFQEIIIAT